MTQNYKNHSRLVTGYHKILGPLLLAGLIGSIVNLVKKIDSGDVYSASLLFLLFICGLLLYWYTRAFPLKAQDRAIRSEENFRYYILTGKPLPEALRMSQIIALRFASDAEFPELVQSAIQNNLSGKAIKESIKLWKEDNYRV
ncbi:DUF6526 family protein [Daejeonella oryzae]|uniref:DUF6526 family protein n=1 Tax=Daejeonella oryzae TaxID=1122943 RepID=UPI00041CB70A|nr:DUF6526 family protein [Daejeonella oryzae]